MKTLIIFFPSIESGGVEKIFYHLLNNFSLKFKKVIVVTSSKIKKNKIPKKIEFLKPNSIFWLDKSRIVKSIVCFFLALGLYSKKEKICMLNLNQLFPMKLKDKVKEIKFMVCEN